MATIHSMAHARTIRDVKAANSAMDKCKFPDSPFLAELVRLAQAEHSSLFNDKVR